jgi:RHS repeat-associated protein
VWDILPRLRNPVARGAQSYKPREIRGSRLRTLRSLGTGAAADFCSPATYKNSHGPTTIIAPPGIPHPEAVEQLVGYTGQERDASTGLYQMGQRWYDPRTGRWLSEDPIGFDGGDPNLYRYVGNGVTYRTDPTGLTQAGNPLNNLFGNTTSIPNFNANLGLSNYYSGQPNLSGGISSYFASAAPSAADFSVFGAGIGTSNFSTLSGGLSSFVGPSQQQIANAQANPSLASPVTRTSYVVRAQTGRTLRPMNGQVAQK